MITVQIKTICEICKNNHLITKKKLIVEYDALICKK